MKLTFDIGGTKIRLGAFSEDGHLMATTIIHTPTNYQEGRAKIEGAALRILSGQHAGSVAVAVAGVLDKTNGTIIESPNLRDWQKKPLVEDIAKITDSSSVILENDAATAALGEAIYGAGKGKRIVAYLTLGTGVGGARVVDGKVDANTMGFEPGNQIIHMNETKEVVPFRLGTLESYVSGTAFAKVYGIKPEACADPLIWQMYAKHLAVGIVNILVLWSPDIIVLGGGVSRSADKFFPLLTKEVVRNIPFPQIPPITQSVLSDDAALYGGLVLLKNSSS